jgi:hypothetical protein
MSTLRLSDFAEARESYGASFEGSTQWRGGKMDSDLSDSAARPREFGPGAASMYKTERLDLRLREAPA